MKNKTFKDCLMLYVIVPIQNLWYWIIGSSIRAVYFDVTPTNTSMFNTFPKGKSYEGKLFSTAHPKPPKVKLMKEKK